MTAALRLVRTTLRLSAIAAVAYGAMSLLHWVEVASDAMPGPGGRVVYLVVLGGALLSYAVLLALPYVPGVEIGIMILAMQGPVAALPVYLATLAGLALAFVMGRVMPARWIAATLGDLGLTRAAGLVVRTAEMDPEEKLAQIRARLPERLGRALIGWRYILLAVALNAPGNWVLGGGGGIMLVAGLSGLFRTGTTLTTIALAVAPVPLAVWFFGIDLT